MPGVLHLLKLSVGPRDVAELRRLQDARRREGPLRHLTRVSPKRAAELLEGGSIYWVVAGFVQVRQRLSGIEESTKDGLPCAALMLDAELVPVEMRPVKPFQGWRYLTVEAAPRDLPKDAVPAEGLDALPPRLRKELRALGLL